MSEPASIEFVLHGKVDGVEITPRTIGLSQSFVDYQPAYDEEALARFTANGSTAWADVP